MKRRSFVKRGTLTLLWTGVAGELFSFVPDDFYKAGVYKNTIPFRKPARRIEEVVPGFLWADAADFDDYGGGRSTPSMSDLWALPICLRTERVSRYLMQD